jgi:uncharacterized protein YqjF (DUF2071 family)
MPFLTATWRDLLMINWPVPAAVLTPLVPRGTELDPWEGTPWVSVVAFRFLATRVLGVPVPFHRDFPEVNLRFYVRRRVDGTWRRAAVFIRELVPRRAIAWVARAAYNEPYLALPMRCAIARRANETTLAFGWRRHRRWEGVRAVTRGAPQPCAAGSAEAFITEHYWGYTRQRDGGTVEYRVAHPPWRVTPAHEVSLDLDARTLYGAAFAEVLAAPPASAFVAEGSGVTVYRPAKVPGD